MTVKSLEATEWFETLTAMVQSELDRQSPGQESPKPLIEAELAQVRRSIAGFNQSLANPELDPRVRVEIQNCWAKAIRQIEDLERDLLALAERQERTAKILADPQQLVDRLNRLNELLEAGNIPELNVELSYHIESIRCFPDGHVVLRICHLGATPELIDEVVTSNGSTGQMDEDRSGETLEPGTVIPRRRTIRRVDDLASAHFAADPNRFAGIPDRFFVVHTFTQPRRRSWADRNAEEVYQTRFAADGSVKATFNCLETIFGRTKPTLQKALRIAKERRHRDNEEPDGDPA